MSRGFCLVVIAVLCVAASLTAVYRADDLGALPPIALGGMLLLIVLPGLSLGAVVLDHRASRARERRRPGH